MVVSPESPPTADATERARAYGERVAAVVHGLPLGVVTTAPDGRITFANDVFVAMLGYDTETDLDGQSIFDLTHPEDRQADEALADTVIRGEQTGYSLEKRYLRRDGSTAWAAITATLVTDAAGAPDFALGIVKDIGARKAAEQSAAEALARAEEGQRMLAALMRYVPEGITIADAPDVRIRMVSDYGAWLTGRPHSALEAISADAHPDAWGIYHADGVTKARPEELPLTRATVAGEVVKDQEWIVRRPDGTYSTILCSAGPIRDAAGVVTGGVIAWRDIDDRKRAAEERERLLAAEREARAAAEAASRARGDFLASMSHELRTPLNAILGYQDLLETGVAGPLTEVQQQYIDRVRASARHLVSLINQVLTYARVEAGAMEYVIAPVRVAALLQTAEPLVAPQAAVRDLALVVHAVGDAVMVLADAEKATQILVNVLANAVKFTPPGGRVEVTTERENGRVAIRVQDTGPGIAPDDLGPIFEAFRQGTRPLHGRTEGTGPGLSISRALARGMGGDLTAESTVGVGSTFTLTLPSAPDGR